MPETPSFPARHLLVISHEASRTGAVIVLLQVLGQLRRHGHAFTIILYRDGEMGAAFRALGEVLVWQPAAGSSRPLSTFLARIRRRTAGTHQQEVKKKVATGSFQAVYANTALAARIVPELAPLLRCPVVCHIHELETVLQTYCRLDLFARAEPFITRYIACAEAVKANLLQNGHVPAGKSVDVVYESVEMQRVRQPARPAEAVRRELGIPDGTFVVGGSGLVEWRKGADLFILLARQLQLAGVLHGIHFLWVGHVDALERLRMEQEIRVAGLQGRVVFTGQKTDPQEYYQLFDVFALTSREDPFPLVVLETAALGVPVLCFEGAGGIPEFVAGGGGMAVPYLDVAGMAEGITRLHDDADFRRQLGEAARTQAAAYDAPLMAAQVMAVLDTAIRQRNT